MTKPASSNSPASDSTELSATPDGTPASLVWVIAITVFISAFLLFQVQPLSSKFILPWFGGGPAVWTTAMLFFQLALFGGYAYAHGINRIKSPKVQAYVHVALLGLAMLSLPIIPRDAWKPSDSEAPVQRILLLLGATVGLPYFLLSSTGPLLQAWFARAYPGRSPYRLYALSNVGSLLALLSYPFFFEPRLELRPQGWLWSGGFVVFAILAAWCGLSVARIPHRVSAEGAVDKSEPTSWPFTIWRWALWLFLPALASMMLLATTNHVCQDVASVPMLWVVPLSLYLLTFIICFDQPRFYVREVFVLLTLAATMMALGHKEFLPEIFKWNPDFHEWVMWALGSPERDSLAFVPELVVHFAALFGICMICHGELYLVRPAPRRLTEYYLMISAGGAIGGVFVSLIAPQIYETFTEWPLGLGVSFVLAAAVFVVSMTQRFGWIAGLAFLLPATGVAVGGVYLMQEWSKGYGEGLYQARNFYGLVSVKELYVGNEPAYCFVSGHIQHGHQLQNEFRRHEPVAYFGEDTGVGKALLWGTRYADAKVAVVGLGVGASAAYAKPGHIFRLYEINPEVIRLARDELPVRAQDRKEGEPAMKRYFHYLADCQGKWDVVLGDARLSLEHELKEGSQQFDVLCLDAFSGDAVPTHLLTREAFEIYFQHLKNREKHGRDGIIVVNITNTYIDLQPVVLGLVDHFNNTAGMDLGVTQIDTYSDDERLLYTTSYMLITRDKEFLATYPGSSLAESTKRVLWTDHYSNLFDLLEKSQQWQIKTKPKQGDEHGEEEAE